MKERLCFMLLLMATGCASRIETIEYPVTPRMATTYVGGAASITWMAEPGEVYTIYYTDAARGTRPDWRPLPQAVRVRGEGRQITVQDSPPEGIVRRYLLFPGDHRP